MGARFLAWLGGLALGCGLAAGATGGNLTVAPTRVDLSVTRTAGVVNLRNNAATPVTVQVQTFAWPGSTDIADLLPTRELLAVPAVLEIPSGEKRPIRIAWRGAPQGDREETYRLIVTEVPPPPKSGGVQFALRLSLPVFVTPDGAAPRPRWALQRVDGEASLQLVNAGNAHLQVRRIRLLGADGRELLEIDRPVYVLAGQQQLWPVALPPSALGAGVSLVAETNVGELLATLSVQGG
jgi:fimbrial chaperone protein